MIRRRLAFACSLVGVVAVCSCDLKPKSTSLRSMAAPEGADPTAVGDTDADLDFARNRPGAVDPGVRGGAPSAGAPLPGLTPGQAAMFNAGAEAFGEIDSVSGTIPNTGSGLGPTFNADNCLSCHSHPSAGGSSPPVNPQVEIASREGAANRVPFFITADGPVREARFKWVMTPSGGLTSTRDGGVHGLFTIGGRSDALNCRLPQPNFEAAARANNLALRIPTPTFGLGLIEAISDEAILSSHKDTGRPRRVFGIAGHPNTSGNDGTITRFGWKAQNKSLIEFSAEAYNVEVGVTNELFPNERGPYRKACQYNATPEDHSDLDAAQPEEMMSDVILFAGFMRMLAPPARAAATPASNRGEVIFAKTGCALCHTPSLPVDNPTIGAISQQGRANLYSDLLVHHMGAGLGDGIIQGKAGVDEFRTAPLWGLGQRLFFLHDGRTKDLVEAILQHASPRTRYLPGSEANEVVRRFRLLPPREKQDLLEFLRSL
jgi:CxxC motif-containing protein (DUF1111 family)